METNRTRFQNEKNQLRSLVLSMGKQALSALSDVADALNSLDRDQATRIVEKDKFFNRLYHEIHEECLIVLAREQPVAGELRELLSDLQIGLELERIADHIASIAQLVRLIKGEAIPPVWEEIFNMIQHAAGMLEKMLLACETHDQDAAEVICATDEEIDRMNEQIIREIMHFMAENKKAINDGSRMIWLVHHIERISDRVTNIGEQIVFIKTGNLPDLNMPGNL